MKKILREDRKIGRKITRLLEDKNNLNLEGRKQKKKYLEKNKATRSQIQIEKARNWKRGGK